MQETDDRERGGAGDADQLRDGNALAMELHSRFQTGSSQTCSCFDLHRFGGSNKLRTSVYCGAKAMKSLCGEGSKAGIECLT